jgi:hypothetical protein
MARILYIYVDDIQGIRKRWSMRLSTANPKAEKV